MESLTSSEKIKISSVLPYFTLIDQTMSVRIATHGNESKSCIFTTYINVLGLLATSKYYQNILIKHNEQNIGETDE